jgi:hypothetical protein
VPLTCRSKIFSFPETSRPAQLIPRFIPGGKAARSCSYHLFPSSVEVENEWRCTSTSSPICFHDVDRAILPSCYFL